MFGRIKQMMVKELIQVLRDPRMRGVVFVAPIVMLIVMSYAVTMDVNSVRIAVLDGDRTPESRELISQFAGSPWFRIVAVVDNAHEAQDLVDREAIHGYVAFQPGFAQAIRAGRSAPLQLVVDGTDSSSARVILGYAGDIVQRYSASVFIERVARAGMTIVGPDRIRLEPRAWYNTNLESRPFYVPGMIAAILGLVSLMLSSMAIVRERELGTLEQLMVTPITPVELIIGKTAPFACVAFLELGIVLCIVRVLFGIPVNGSLSLLLLAAGLYVMSMIGAGLLISTSCRTQQQATMTNILFFMPSILLSGFMFPVANMPRVIQWVTLANPMRYFVEVARAVILKGTGLDILWPQLLALALLGIVALGIASLTFRKTMA